MFSQGAGVVLYMRLLGRRRALRFSSAETRFTVYRRIYLEIIKHMMKFGKQIFSPNGFTINLGHSRGLPGSSLTVFAKYFSCF